MAPGHDTAELEEQYEVYVRISLPKQAFEKPIWRNDADLALDT